jgi:hypothetical protein
MAFIALVGCDEADQDTYSLHAQAIAGDYLRHECDLLPAPWMSASEQREAAARFPRQTLELTVWRGPERLGNPFHWRDFHHLEADPAGPVGAVPSKISVDGGPSQLLLSWIDPAGWRRVVSLTQPDLGGMPYLVKVYRQGPTSGQADYMFAGECTTSEANGPKLRKAGN